MFIMSKSEKKKTYYDSDDEKTVNTDFFTKQVITKEWKD